MPKPLSPLQIGLLSLGGAVLVLLRIDDVSSASVDLAHHYALVFRLAEHWQLVPADPSLGEMNIYPRYSHILAAILGKLLGSPFLGMQVLALGALALVWASYLVLLNCLPLRQALLASLALVGLLYVNEHAWQLALHGGELVDNFFFSQLVAQAFALCAIAVAVRLEMRRSVWHAALFLMAAMVALTGMHLLPALELLGVLAGILLIHAVTCQGSRRQRLQAGALAAALLAISVLAVLRHPAFAAMRSIAENNGDLRLVHFDSKVQVAVLCLVVMLVALCLLVRWHRNGATSEMAVLKYLGVYGAATAALCLLQIGMLSLHEGSDYAVKKYLFGLCTFLLVGAAVLIGGAGQRVLARLDRCDALTVRVLQTVVLLATLSAAMTRVPPPRKSFDASALVALERQLLALHDAHVAPDASGKHAVIIDLQGQPPTINYMFSIAIAHTPREAAIPDVLMANNLARFDDYHAIISSAPGSRYAACAGVAAGSLRLTDVGCARQVAADAQLCKGVLDFSLAGRLDATMLSGFSDAEAGARWTDGGTASISCRVGPAVRRATLVLTPFIAATLVRQRLAVSVNGSAPTQHVLTLTPGGAAQELVIALPAMAPGSRLRLTLALPDAAAPSVLGVSADRRKLGVALHTLTFE